MATPSVGWMSLLPAAITTVWAFRTRQVLVALFVGVLTGTVVLLFSGASLAEANPITRFLLPAVGSAAYAKILVVYLWCLGGMIGIWSRTGGPVAFANRVGARIAKGRRSSMFFAWIVGVVFHQGGTVSTVLAGTSVKPVTDRHRVSHEELSYIVDSTASPVATILPFNAWPAYVAALVAGTIPTLPNERAAVRFFFESIPFNFYAMIAVLSTLGLALGFLPWRGKRLRLAQERAEKTGELDAPGAEPLVMTEDPALSVREGYVPSLADFLVPLVVLLTVAIVPTLFFDADLVSEAFVLCVLSAMLTARMRGMPLRDVIAAFVEGCEKMTIGALVLALAVTLGQVARELGAADYVVGVIGDDIPAWSLPAMLTALCMAIAFATGSSWGTYAVVFPVAMPLAHALGPSDTYLHACFGAVLGGAVFGDQCSPISDTTIFSSMFTGCDMMDHVRSQIPPALVSAGIAAVLSTLVVWSLG